ncbi:acid protease [Cubamyces lactineus]|nr:acid protease [Cubamyces lactineus]
MFSSRAHLLLSLCASYALAFTPPARVNVPLFLSPAGRPVMGVGMSTNNVQNFNFTLTTSLGYTTVAGKSCQDCSDTPLYDVSLSDSAKPLSGQPSVSLGDSGYQGTLIKEDCKLYASGGQTWNYPNQTIIVASNQSKNSIFDKDISGLLGLGTLKNPTDAAGFSASFDDGIYGQYYIRNPDATNFTFGMDLKPSPVIPGNGSSLTIGPGAKSLGDSGVGTLHWLQPDSSAYQTDKVQWRPVQIGITTGYLANNTQPDLTVQLDGWSAAIGSNNVGVSQPILVNVDPYHPGIYMPMQEARLIHDAISGSEQTTLSTMPGQTVAWTVPCNTQLQFAVIIGEQRFTVDQSILIVDQGDGTCVSIIEGFTDSSVTQYIFGQNFMSQLYLIFNIPKSGISSVGFAPRTVSSTTSRDIGAIVGGTVGGVAGVVALGLLAFYLIRRRQDNTFFKRAAEIEEEHKVASTVEPYTFGQNMVAHDPRGFDSSGLASPPASAHDPLLGMHDAGPVHLPPPTYEEASEAGGSSAPRGYPRDSKMTYTTASPPVSPNQTAFSGSGSSAV